MSGPSAQQVQLGDEQSQFYQQGMQESQSAFSEQQSLLAEMEKIYQPILNRGPNAEGFSDAEKENLDSQAEEGTASNYSKAAKAVGENIAAGSGDNPLPSGSGEQLKEEVAQSAAGQESQEESQILGADYAEGEHQFEDAGNALANVSGQLNPVAYESGATGAGSAAETTEKDINAESNSWETAVLGAAGSLGSAVIGENPGGVFD